MDWLNIEIPNADSKGHERSVHNTKYAHNLMVLERWDEIKKVYPALQKVIGKAFRYLLDLNLYGQSRWISPLSWKRTQGIRHSLFFGSNRYFASRFKYGDHTTWNRNVNILCTLGLIGKVPPNYMGGIVGRKRARLRWKKAQSLGFHRDDAHRIRPMNFYFIPLYNQACIEEANIIANILIAKRFRKNAFSKIALLKWFGPELANRVFPDERFISEYSDYVMQKITQFILHDIDQHGYTTKEMVIHGVKLDMGKVSPKEYGFGGTMKTIVAREFDRSLNDILDGYGLEYRKVNKELKERFRLDSYKTIIFGGTV